jgi:hypothetical protein
VEHHSNSDHRSGIRVEHLAADADRLSGYRGGEGGDDGENSEDREGAASPLFHQCTMD